MSLTNKVVIITGAGSGIGESIALHFSKLSAKLCLIEKNEENLCKIAEKCKKFNYNRILKAVIDVCNDNDLRKSIESVVHEYHGVDVLINCAGIAGHCSITDSGILDDFDKVLNVNLRSLVAAIHFATPYLIKNRGNIINISSVLGKLTVHGSTAYNISKAAVTHLTRCTALELAEHGVRVNCISPGPAETNLIINAGKTPEESKNVYDIMLKQLPLNYLVKVEEVAEMAGFLASDKATCITGANMLVDSGLAVASCVRVSK